MPRYRLNRWQKVMDGCEKPNGCPFAGFVRDFNDLLLIFLISLNVQK